MSKDKNSTCCNQECNQGRDCPVRLGTHKPAEALHQVVEPTATLAEIPEAVLDAVAEALGGAYDCLRVWSAWGVGTMGPDDFALVAEDGERLADIARAAITADRAALEAVNMRELTAYRTTVQNLEAELAALKAAPAAVAVPDGWQMVPVQDTSAMWTAGGRAIKSCAGHERDAASLAYKAMLAAAPALAATPPAQMGDSPVSNVETTAPQAQDVQRELTQAARDVLAERARQIEVEGYPPEDDDGHVNDELAALAALYVMPDGARDWDASSTGYPTSKVDGEQGVQGWSQSGWIWPRQAS